MLQILSLTSGKLKKQRMVLNGQLFSWSNIEANTPSLIFIFDLYKRIFSLITSARLFADNISNFPLVDNINLSAINLNGDLSKITAWANQWKMTFNPDPNKRKRLFFG